MKMVADESVNKQIVDRRRPLRHDARDFRHVQSAGLGAGCGPVRPTKFALPAGTNRKSVRPPPNRRPFWQSNAWMEESDEAAIARARAGDSDGFRVLVERYSRGLFHLAWRMTGNEQDAEDVVQETLLSAWRRMGQFEARSAFGTWLHRIAVNQALDLVRARRRQPERQQAAEVDPDVVLEMAARGPGPDRMAQSAELGRRLQAAMAELSPMERTAFVLRHFEGMSIEQIGGTLGRRTEAAKNCVFRAVQKLRRALAPAVGAAR